MDQTALLQAGRNCWRIEHADRFAFIVDAQDYFIALRKAMITAQHSILLIGWDFDPRISFGIPDDGGPERLGDFIMWLVDRTPSLKIRLLQWDTGAIKELFKRNLFYTFIRWKAHSQIELRLDGAHPFAGSHHQKIVSIDDNLAFCGGIDMTDERWDTRAHLDDDPGRVGPDGIPNDPWHDATSAFDGDAARAISDLARLRWKTATKQELAPVYEKRDCWPEGLKPNLRDLRLGIARTIPEMDDIPATHEIETMYLDLIARAKRFFYAESQYFASRRIAHAIARRLEDEDGPEIVIINPHTADGWLEPVAMDTARARLVESLKRIDKHGRFRIYHPVTKGGNGIYVHAKVTIVDDMFLRVGSSNFNNRSMRLDTECDVILSADEPGCVHLREEIATLRNDLLAEHLGVGIDLITEGLSATGSLIKVIENLRGEGRSLVPYEIPELSGIEEWLADNEILDPDGPEEIFETPSKRGLFTGWGRIRKS